MADGKRREQALFELFVFDCDVVCLDKAQNLAIPLRNEIRGTDKVPGFRVRFLRMEYSLTREVISGLRVPPLAAVVKMSRSRLRKDTSVQSVGDTWDSWSEAMHIPF